MIYFHFSLVFLGETNQNQNKQNKQTKKSEKRESHLVVGSERFDELLLV